MNHNTKYYLFIVLVFGLGSIILQSLLVPLIEINLWRPDLVLVIVLLTGKRFGAVGGSSAGFFLGIIQDSLSGMPVGITALPKALVGYLSGKTKAMRFTDTTYYILFLVFILIHELISYAFFQFKTDISYLYLVYSRVFPNTAYSMIILLVINNFSRKYFSE